MKQARKLADGLQILSRYQNPTVTAEDNRVRVRIQGGVHFRDADQLHELGWARNSALRKWEFDLKDE